MWSGGVVEVDAVVGTVAVVVLVRKMDAGK